MTAKLGLLSAIAMTLLLATSAAQSGNNEGKQKSEKQKAEAASEKHLNESAKAQEKGNPYKAVQEENKALKEMLKPEHE